jgi:hypothetical protein
MFQVVIFKNAPDFNIQRGKLSSVSREKMSTDLTFKRKDYTQYVSALILLDLIGSGLKE